MTPLEATALLAYHQAAALGTGDPFDLAQARVFTVSREGEITVVIASGDVYLGLHVLPAAFEKLGEVPVIGIETCGWAAPVAAFDGIDCSPSEDPRRQRVRLVAVVNRRQEVASAMAFQNEPEDVQTTLAGEGTLAEALKECMERIDLMQSLPRLDQWSNKGPAS